MHKYKRYYWLQLTSFIKLNFQILKYQSDLLYIYMHVYMYLNYLSDIGFQTYVVTPVKMYPSMV